MADFSIKANDRLPVIRAVLSTVDGPVNLTDAEVDFIMRPTPTAQGAPPPTPKINLAAVVEDAVGGVVYYPWAIGDTDTPGNYQAEWEVTWSDGKTQTFPTRSYHSIEVLADLDSAA